VGQYYKDLSVTEIPLQIAYNSTDATILTLFQVVTKVIFLIVSYPLRKALRNRYAVGVAL